MWATSKHILAKGDKAKLSQLISKMHQLFTHMLLCVEVKMIVGQHTLRIFKKQPDKATIYVVVK